jgi:proline dehydrogenase
VRRAEHVDLQDTETTYRHTNTIRLLERKALLQWILPLLIHPRGEAWARIALRVPVVGKRLIRHWGPFPYFCGGVTISDSLRTVSRLAGRGIRAILDFSAEGLGRESDFDHTRDEVLRIINVAKTTESLPFVVFKLTGLGREELLEKASGGPMLDQEDQTELNRVTARVRQLCQAAHDANRRVLIDAEETWIQPAIDEIAHEMMKQFNRRGRATVYNTAQMYRQDRMEYLSALHAMGLDGHFTPGVKLVRGAYMEAERERATRSGGASPIHPTKETTDVAFDAALKLCVDHLDDLWLVVGTHNPESIGFLLECMADRGLAPNDPRVECSQLLGMGDNLSLILAKYGYNVSKYVPYGPLDRAIPYLLRRARENSSVADQTGRELQLVGKELSRRWPRLTYAFRSRVD